MVINFVVSYMCIVIFIKFVVKYWVGYRVDKFGE